MAKLITPGGDVKDIIPRTGPEFSHSELMEAVEGWCEMLAVYYVRGGVRSDAWLVVNPCATSLGLRANAAATMIARNAGHDEVIYGNVLLCSIGEIR